MILHEFGVAPLKLAAAGVVLLPHYTRCLRSLLALLLALLFSRLGGEPMGRGCALDVALANATFGAMLAGLGHRWK